MVTNFQARSKSGENARIFILAVLLALILLTPISILTAQTSPALQYAPLNPEFVKLASGLSPGPRSLVSANEDYKGLRPIPVDLAHLQGTVVTREIPRFGYPVSYDLRLTGKLTPVKDQGSAGSCWAFATYGSLESNLLPGESRDFSENNLKNTHSFDFGHSDGGNQFMSMAYLTRWNGPVNETDDPYNPLSGVSLPGLTTQKHVQEVDLLPDRSNFLDNDNIKQALMDHGAVYTSMNYNSFYYNSGTYAYYNYGGGSSNHAVTIVGWDDNFDRYKFLSTPPGNGAFIIKNSWGTAWGQSGYFYISYYDTNIGKDNTLFLNAETASNYQRIYQYDPFGWVSNLGYSATTAWMANVFSAVGTEQLKAIGFYTSAVNTSYQLSIYSGANSGPTSGSLATTQSGSINLPGYHTIALASPVNLTGGQKFSVVVRLTTPGYNYPIPYEFQYPGYCNAANAGPGQSFVSADGSLWSDLTSIYSTANVCLKAYSVTGTAPTIIQEPSDQTATQGDSVTISVTAGGSPAPTYQWRFNGINITGETSSTLTLHNVQTSQAGHYSVVISNNSGSVTSREALLTVNLHPVPTVTGLQVKVDFYSVNLIWTNPSENWTGTKILRKTGSEPLSPNDGTVIYNGRGNAFSDTNLLNGTYYYAFYTYNAENSYSAAVKSTVVAPNLYNKTVSVYQPGAGGQFSSMNTAQNWRDNLYTYWGSQSLLLGKSNNGVNSDLWLYFPQIIGNSGGQIPPGSKISRARLVLKVQDDFSFGDNLSHLIKIYPITDPDHKGLPFFGGVDGIRTGLDFCYRDHRLGVNMPWKNGAQNILGLFDGVNPADTFSFYPEIFDTHLLNAIQFDVTSSLQAWMNGEPNQGWFITADDAWQNGDTIRFSGKDAAIFYDRPYLEVVYGNDDPVPPGAVTLFSALPGDGKISLSWTNPVDADFAGVKIVRRAGVIPFNPYDGALVYDGAATSCIDAGLNNGTVYYYTAYAYDNLKNYSAKTYLKTIPGTLDAPFLNNPLAGPGLVTLSWSPVSGADEFHLYRAAVNEETLLLKETNATNYIDANVANKSYTYWVAAVNNYGEGKPSEVKTVTPGITTSPAAPTGLGLNPLSGTAIALTWTDSSTNESGFVIERRTGGPAWTEIAGVSFNHSSYTDDGLQPNTVYEYRVKAVNSGGASAYSNSVSTGTLDLPLPPSHVIWEVISACHIKLNWVDLANETGYKIELYDEMGLIYNINLAANTTFSYITGFTPGKDYHIKLTATNETGAATVLIEHIRTISDPKGGLL